MTPQQRYVSNNRDKVNARRRAYHHRTKKLKPKRSLLTKREKANRAKLRKIKQKYGLGQRAYAALMRKHPTCPICRNKFTKKRYRVVDHNHTTGRVRGLLCHPCNAALGLMQDSPKSLKGALAYLRNTRSR